MPTPSTPSLSSTATPSPSTLLEFFIDVPDPRRRQKSCEFRFLDLVFLAVTAVVCGCDDWEEIADFGEAELDWYQQYGMLLSGAPSHDTLRRVFMLLDKKKFSACLLAWMQSVCGQLSGVIAIDGKTMRGSRTADKRGVHVVSAWSASLRLTFAHRETAEKSNEITAIPELLRLLSLHGCLVTMDAMGCQREIAQTICEQGGDYLLAVKDNQPTLAHDIAAYFTEAQSHQWKDSLQHTEHTTDDISHGRREIRKCHACHIPQPWLKHDWHQIKQIVHITRTRTIIATGITTTEQHYAITSDANADAQKILNASRQHWGIENTNHYVLDVVFNEDNSRVRTHNGPENFATIRRFALNILNLNKAKMSIKRMRRSGYYYREKREEWIRKACLHVAG